MFGSIVAMIASLKSPEAPYQMIFGGTGSSPSPSGSGVAVAAAVRSSVTAASTPIAAAEPKGTTTSASALRADSKKSRPPPSVSSTVRPAIRDSRYEVTSSTSSPDSLL